MAIAFQIIGHKKSGKTLITTSLIKKLTLAGYSVAAIKHDAHHATMDIPGTDSDRMSSAGASQVILQSETGLFFHQEGHVPALPAMVDFLGRTTDFVLIEGHKEAILYPKLLLLKPHEKPDEVLTTQPVKIGTLFNNQYAELVGQNEIVDWCFNYLKQVTEEE
ncbi:molybdopterin-guanine dinucleotide biosynthesis protein B [uncultured Limosilactobacillus sp.]|mgnify:CR=1 FL=1|uniref:molybdopterin-guanine dinucleotide biosynthesis protein B n=1 Tax=uncultured Limosilactobacillus sp. TaxID=2837629 RepID=UPI00265FA006|nr:molybdopterin-guanine dinucleotide biosynthesis protein B [uncultured Limosilactobacillus sp.]